MAIARRRCGKSDHLDRVTKGSDHSLQTAETELITLRSENESLREELRAAQNAAVSHRNAKLLEAPGADGGTGAVARVLEAEQSSADA